MELLSTSALANELNLKSTELFDKLKTLGWLIKVNNKWVLTHLGKEKGGQMKSSQQFGDYVVWPGNIAIENNPPKDKSKFLNATAIGKHFGTSSQRLNLILSELGWMEKNIAGWQLTKLGRSIGGRQYEHETSGGTYILWSESVLTNANLASGFIQVDTVPDQPLTQQSIVVAKPSIDNFRDRFPATLRTKDGHMVRSRAEVIIDNALYDYKLAHAYERKLPIEENLYSDFFIPTENVYIEFWGMEDDAKYAERKKTKIEIYKKYDFKLIELNNSDIANLDDHLPKKLLKYGIRVY